MTPNHRSRALLESSSWLVDIVERRITRILTRDLFGCFDLLAVRGAETLAIQTTTASNMAARRKKVLASSFLPALRAAGWQIALHGWRTVKGRWCCKQEAL